MVFFDSDVAEFSIPILNHLQFLVLKSFPSLKKVIYDLDKKPNNSIVFILRIIARLLVKLVLTFYDNPHQAVKLFNFHVESGMNRGLIHN